MPEKNQQDNKENQQAGTSVQAEFDAASKSLANALRISFVALKYVMLALVLLYFLSGLKKIESDEEAVVLRFGKIHRLLDSGLHFVAPYPIDEVVRINVQKTPAISTKAFWYYQRPGQTGKPVRFGKSLNPIRDGYCITRSEPIDIETVSVTAGDYSIVNCKWETTYKIYDPKRFFANIYTRRPKPGELEFNVITKSIQPLLKNLLESSVVTAAVNYTINDVLFDRVSTFREHVRSVLQANLDLIKSGIKIVSVQMTQSTWPLQVDKAYQESIKAFQKKQTMISEAQTYAGNTLNGIAGAIAEDLLASVKDPNTSDEELERLWSQVTGKVREEIAQARAYRVEVAESAEANAKYLQEILPQYRKYPDLVIRNIYQDAMEKILANVHEKIIVEPGKSIDKKELRILLNRDPAIKTEEKKKESNDGP